MNSSSTRPTSWDAARDEAFFRIVQSVFPSALLEAFTVLLASNDDAAVPAYGRGRVDEAEQVHRSVASSRLIKGRTR